MHIFCPVIDRLLAKTKTCSATSYTASSAKKNKHYTKTTPLTHARNPARSPRTSTVASRFNLVLFLAASLFASGNFIPHSVSNRPGETLLTLTLGAQMTASALDRWIAAALVTEYGRLLPLGLTPATLAVVTKAPSVFSSSARAACASHRCDFTLYRKHLSQSSSIMPSSRFVKLVMRVQPTLETTTSSRPMVEMVSSTRARIESRLPTSAWMEWKRGVEGEGWLEGILCSSSIRAEARVALFAKLMTCSGSYELGAQVRKIYALAYNHTPLCNLAQTLERSGLPIPLFLQ